MYKECLQIQSSHFSLIRRAIGSLMIFLPIAGPATANDFDMLSCQSHGQKTTKWLINRLKSDLY